MKVRTSLVGICAPALFASCAIESDDPPEPVEQNLRLNDRVLEVVCNNSGERDMRSELPPLVREARVRDGRSDRVWEVADSAHCDSHMAKAGELPRG